MGLGVSGSGRGTGEPRVWDLDIPIGTLIQRVAEDEIVGCIIFVDAPVERELDLLIALDIFAHVDVPRHLQVI